MKIKSKNFSKSAKVIFALFAICGGIFTSCYEKDDLDVNPPVVTPTPSDAVYYVKGTITDYETNEALVADHISLSDVSETRVESSTFLFTLSKPGDYILTVTKEGYKNVIKTFTINEIEAGQESYTDVSIVMKATEEIVVPPPTPGLKEANYTLQGSVADKETGAAITSGEIIVNNQTYSITNGIYGAIPVSSGPNTVRIVVEGYYAYSSIVQISQKMINEDEELTVPHVADHMITKIEEPIIEPPVPTPTYPVVASANISGVTFKLVGYTNEGESVNEQGSTINVKVKAGSYILTAEATGYPTQSREFVLTAGILEGYSWYAVFEKEEEIEEYDVTTYINVIVLDNETGADITNAVTVTVNNKNTTSNGFESVVGDNIVRVTDSSDVYYGTTYTIRVDKKTSNKQGETETVAATVRLNKVPVTPPNPDPVYTVKAVSEDSNVLFALYNASNDQIVESSVGLLLIEVKSGSYYMTAKREGKTIDPTPVFTLDETTPNYIWSVAIQDMKDRETGDLSFIPGQEIEADIEIPANMGEIGNIIDGLVLTIPADALDEATNMNVRIIANNTDSDMNSTQPSTSILTFEGTPSGLTFNNPLLLEFTNNLNLTSMNFYYLVNGEWIKEVEVASASGSYSSEIPHFSHFKLGFDYSRTYTTSVDEIVQSGSGNIYNGTYYEKAITVKYNIVKGLKYVTPLDDLLAGLNATAKGKQLLKILIEDVIYNHNSNKVLDDFETDEVVQEFKIPALNVLTSATATQALNKQTYTIIVNGQQLNVEVLEAGQTVLDTEMSTISHGHGHGHGHGNDWNSGGGIAISE